LNHDSVSTEALEFVKSLLKAKPEDRPTAEKALSDKWFSTDKSRINLTHTQVKLLAIARMRKRNEIELRYKTLMGIEDLQEKQLVKVFEAKKAVNKNLDIETIRDEYSKETGIQITIE